MDVMELHAVEGKGDIPHLVSQRVDEMKSVPSRSNTLQTRRPHSDEYLMPLDLLVNTRPTDIECIGYMGDISTNVLLIRYFPAIKGQPRDS